MGIHWIAQFVIVSATIFYQGANTPHGLVTLEMPVERMVRIFGFADAGSYLQAAQNLVANGRITPEWQWVCNLWPPGMVWVDALSIRFSPLTYGVTIGLLTSLVWSIALSVLTWPLIRHYRHRLTAMIFIIEFLILGTSPFSSWMFDEGLFYAEGLASALFLTALAIMLLRLRTTASMIRWISDGIIVGTLLAAVMYLRSSFQLLPWALGLSAVILVANVATLKFQRKVVQPNLVFSLLMVSVSVISMLVLTQPYRAYLQQTQGRSNFVVTETLVYNHAWERAFKDGIPQWMVDAGSNWGCELDPKTCNQIHALADAGTPLPADDQRDLLIRAALNHPAEYVASRVSAVSSQWFGDEINSYNHTQTVDLGEGSFLAGNSTVRDFHLTQGLLYLVLLVAALIGSLQLVRRGRIAYIVIPILVLAILAPFAVAHVEVRYLIPLKLVGLLSPLIFISLAQLKADSKSTEPHKGPI